MNEIKVHGVVYRQQYRKCGDLKCKCKSGQGHGPYWYKFDGASRGQYVGKSLPAEVQSYESLLQKSKKKIGDIRTRIEKQRDDAYRAYSQAQNELRTLQALEAHEHVDAKMLERLGLSALVLKGV